MREPLDPLPQHVADLLEAERAVAPPRQEVQDRVRARVAATLIGATTTGAATTVAAAKGVGTLALASLATKATLIAVVVVSAGAGGVVLHRRHLATQGVTYTQTQPPKVSRVANDPRAETAISPVPTPAPSLAPPATTFAHEQPHLGKGPTVERRQVRAVERTPVHDGVPDTAAETPEELADENALIEAARSALGARDAQAAAGFLQRHARLHPAGQMEEEREALWVQTLIAEGDAPGARARAETFRRRFPHSIQLEAVSAALEKIP